MVKQASGKDVEPHLRVEAKQEIERMVRSEGFEPPTYWFVANCSIQLS
jgi:hypothetical protein